jgi:comEA protein
MFKTLPSRLLFLTLFVAVVLSFSTVSMAAQDTGAAQPSKQTTKTPEKTQAKEQTTSAKIDINKASAAELQTLKGIGPQTAQAIVKYREENGPFKSVEDLNKVKGIGKKKVESLKDKITVQ